MTPSEPPSPPRLLSLDAYRGAIMLLMASAGFEITHISQHYPQSSFWQFAGYEFDHAAWAGCTLWDLIQPAFMFMVGVALTLSSANRKARGASNAALFGHAIWRSLLFILIAVFLTSFGSRRTPGTDWIFTNVLAQIGLAYPFLFLISFASARVQWSAAIAILLLYWAAFALHPLPPEDFDWKHAGVPNTWPHFSGFERHWEKNANAAATFDRWFLNLFPREAPYIFSPGGYETLNFVPSLATMIFGLRAGARLLCDASMQDKVLRLCIAGLLGIAAGLLLSRMGVCPIVKRIWTPSFALLSGGWVTLFLAAFFAAIEWRGWRSWAFPAVVVGFNPITMYCGGQLLQGFLKESVRRHFGQNIFKSFGALYEPTLERVTVLVLLWLLLLWMYRRKIALRI